MEMIIFSIGNFNSIKKKKKPWLGIWLELNMAFCSDSIGTWILNCLNNNLIFLLIVTMILLFYYNETVLNLVFIGFSFSTVSTLLYVMSGCAYCAMMMIILNVCTLVKLYTVHCAHTQCTSSSERIYLIKIHGNVPSYVRLVRRPNKTSFVLH